MRLLAEFDVRKLMYRADKNLPTCYDYFLGTANIPVRTFDIKALLCENSEIRKCEHTSKSGEQQIIGRQLLPEC